jgi:RNA polymerase sigma factor (sigma-70 family)
MKLSRRIEEEILLLKIRHGDQEAFAAVYDTYVDQLFRFVSYRVQNEELAQDITSELFLKMWQQLSAEGTAKVTYLQAYLYRSARNLIADHYRTVQETLPLEEASEMSAVMGADMTEVAVSLSDVERAVKRLKPEWQEVIILACVESMKPSEIAPIIDKSPAATRVILHRALQELKKILRS